MDWLANHLFIAVWLEAVGTVGALLWLTADFVVFRPRSRRRAEDENREATARSVGVTSSLEDPSANGDLYTVRWEVKNASAYPVHDLKVIINNWTALDGGPEGPAAMEIVVGTLLGNDSVRDRSKVQMSSKPQSFRFYNGPVGIEFVDIWGQPWEAGPGYFRRMRYMPRVC